MTTLGIIGLGVISGQYLETLRRVSNVRIVAVADAFADRLEGCLESLRSSEVASRSMEATLRPRTTSAA